MYQTSTITNTNPMKKTLLKDFFLCGALGWCLECFWTGLGCVCKHRKDRKLTCKTSLWMFPIYGLAAFILPLSKAMKNRCVLVRGGVYAFIIFAMEYLSGKLLKKYRACPWDYSRCKCNVDGIIRIDYLPVWFFVGLLYEKFLKKTDMAHL